MQTVLLFVLSIPPLNFAADYYSNDRVDSDPVLAVDLGDLVRVEVHDLVDAPPVGAVVVGDQLAAVLAPGVKVLVGGEVDYLECSSYNKIK